MGLFLGLFLGIFVEGCCDLRPFVVNMNMWDYVGLNVVFLMRS